MFLLLPLSFRCWTGDQSYQFSYGYNLAGALTSEVYPSGRRVQASYDAANRISQVTGTGPYANKTPGSTTYLSQVQYAAQGAPSFQKYGNTVTRNISFNSRLQPKRVADTLNNDNEQYLFIQDPICWGGDNSPSCDASAQNNGNMYGALVFQGGPGPYYTLAVSKQAYTYDSVKLSLGGTKVWPLANCGTH